ncbi:MAG: hypothetical protein H7Z72_00790 [Bacteroidetes bacterium]|nr:hypothetical protein [Fibrella sp.]
MKNLLIAIVLLLTVSSCFPKKNDDKDPDPEPELAGAYQVSRLVIGSGSAPLIPATGNSASATVVRSTTDMNKITVSLSGTINGAPASVNIGSFTIRKGSGSSYDVLNPSTNVNEGSINGTDLTLSYTGVNNQQVTLIARK